MEGTRQAAKPVSTKVAEQYRWGGQGEAASDGWYLLRSPGLHVIEEAMPPGAVKSRNFHTHARHFFYVLEGELTMEMERKEFNLTQGNRDFSRLEASGDELQPGAFTLSSGKPPAQSRRRDRVGLAGFLRIWTAC